MKHIKQYNIAVLIESITPQKTNIEAITIPCLIFRIRKKKRLGYCFVCERACSSILGTIMRILVTNAPKIFNMVFGGSII